MTYEFIKYEASGGIARVTLNRPEKLNALSPQLQAELIECLTNADEDPDIRVITLRGAGRAFCAAQSTMQILNIFSIIDMAQVKALWTV